MYNWLQELYFLSANTSALCNEIMAPFCNTRFARKLIFRYNLFKITYKFCYSSCTQ